MNVALPADLEKRVSESVERGEFGNRDEFFKEAAELLLDLRHGYASPVAVDEHWENRVETFIEEAHASGEATVMTDHDWEEVERRGLALIEVRKKA
ncbi:MAG: ribbon-helix-helix domain-containing protein [Terriglobia bacterium]